MAEEAAIALVDTHTHLNDEKFAGDVEDHRARPRGRCHAPHQHGRHDGEL